MASYPTSPRLDFLNWATSHAQVFEDQEANIGLSPQQVAAFQAALTTARASETALTNAQELSKGSAITNTANFAALKRQASACVRSIKTFAENNNNDNIYVLAQIPPPADPESLPPPGQPTNLTVELSARSGALTLRWKAVNPKGAAGTSYIVRRRLPSDPAGAFQFIGATGVKKFIDNAFTAGPDSVQYTVQGQRSDKSGAESEVFFVSFGRNGLGQQTAFVSNENQPVRLAA